MSTGIVDNQIIADVNLWKHTVYGKFIIVLTKRTGDIVFVVAWCIFFAEDGNMMISTVHSRTHQIAGTSVQTNIFFVNMFLMNTFCYEIAIRSKHVRPRKLCGSADFPGRRGRRPLRVGADSISARGCFCRRERARANNVRPYRVEKFYTLTPAASSSTNCLATRGLRPPARRAKAAPLIKSWSLGIWTLYCFASSSRMRS